MLFNSYIFILAFLPTALIGYYLLNHFNFKSIAQIVLLGMSFLFYGYFNPKYVLILASSIIVNYFFSVLLKEKKNETINFFHKIRIRKIILFFGIIFNIGLIFYFKYYDFFIENINSLFKSNITLKNIVLPLGISFFTFQQISYVVDSYYGKTASYTFLEYAVFVSFFPQLIAGPIVLHNELIPQLRDKKNLKLNQQNLANGIYIFTIGLFKKVLIADTFGKAVGWGYASIDAMTSMDAILVMISYTFQIYFDFSGYCDMAMGIASLFNIKLPANFHSPYKATSIIDFWDRWHITLTRFLRTYIYFPLGGSKKGKIRTYLNVMITFLISGLWHGASWTFVVWGGFHGLANILTRIFKHSWEKLHLVSQWFFTFLFLNITWIFFRSENISQGIQIIKKIIFANNLNISNDLINCFVLPEINLLTEKIFVLGKMIQKINGFYMWAFIFMGFFIVLNSRNSSERELKPNLQSGLLTIFLLCWSVLSLSDISQFLYFNF